MQDLTLVGLTEDGSKLVLVADTGEKYALPADSRLRAALRGELARPGQLERRMDSALRPRDIQARIRAGESPHEVAEAAQTTIERIMSFATPVLAERAHIAERAQRASIRRRAGEGPARIFGDAVAEHLRARRVSPDSVDWDSWRREDGRWTVVASYDTVESSRTARFVYDVQGRYVVAEDDEARALVGEATTRAPQAAPAGPAGPRRLSAVGPDTGLSLGDDAIELVTGAESEEQPTADQHERTVDLTQTARDLRGGTSSRTDSLGPSADADWMATQATDRPRNPRRESAEESVEQYPRAAEVTSRHDESAATAPHREPSPTDAPEPAEGHGAARPGRAAGTAPAEAAAPESATEAEQEPAEETPPPAPKKAGRKGRRASVPSWDEIMFGGGRSE